MQRKEDGTVHFWRIKEHFQSQFPQIPHWSKRGRQKRDISTTLTMREQSFTSVLFKDTGRNLIDPALHVRSLFIPSSTMDLHLDVRNQARDKQYFCLFIQETTNTQTDLEKTDLRMYHVHNTCRTHGRNIKRRYFGSILILQFGKIEILSDSIECNDPSRNTSSPLSSKSC